jgi:hypothetical protein
MGSTDVSAWHSVMQGSMMLKSLSESESESRSLQAVHGAKSKQILKPWLMELLSETHWMAPNAALTAIPSSASPVPENCVPPTVNTSRSASVSNVST